MAPMIIYHRGRHGDLGDANILKENSIEAFERAVQEGAEMIEFDVWTDLRISHDPGTLSALTLDDVLTLVNGRCGINIEIKSPATAAEALILIKSALKNESFNAEQIVLSSFHHETALLCKRELPEVRVGVINDGVLQAGYIDVLAKKGIDNIHLEWANIYMDIEAGYEMRRVAQKNDMSIWTWTVNSVDVYETVSAYGVDAIFTDRPDIIGDFS